MVILSEIRAYPRLTILDIQKNYTTELQKKQERERYLRHENFVKILSIFMKIPQD
jgi:hypothetical protein